MRCSTYIVPVDLSLSLSLSRALFARLANKLGGYSQAVLSGSAASAAVADVQSAFHIDLC